MKIGRRIFAVTFYSRRCVKFGFVSANKSGTAHPVAASSLVRGGSARTDGLFLHRMCLLSFNRRDRILDFLCLVHVSPLVPLQLSDRRRRGKKTFIETMEHQHSLEASGGHNRLFTKGRSSFLLLPLSATYRGATLEAGSRLVQTFLSKIQSKVFEQDLLYMQENWIQIGNLEKLHYFSIPGMDFTWNLSGCLSDCLIVTAS